MRQFKTVTIGGHSYQIGQLGARQARDVALLVIEHNAQTLAGLGTDGGLGGALAAAAKGMRSQEYWTHVVEPLFGQVLTASGEVLLKVYDDHFIGRLGEDLHVLVAAIEHNCGGFIEAFSTHALTSLGVVSGKAGQPAKAGSKPERTGTSGGR